MVVGDWWSNNNGFANDLRLFSGRKILPRGRMRSEHGTY